MKLTEEPYMRKFLPIMLLSLFLVHCSPFQITPDGFNLGLEENSHASINLTASYINHFLDDDNTQVDYWLNFYQKQGRSQMKHALERSTKYIPMMKGIFNKNKLPEELIYVSLVESGFISKIVSSANAVGYWQFIKDTGLRYGLKINNEVDERLDPFDSTEAATLYLKDLYLTFEDWYLTLAAYNSGEKRISDAILINKNRNFWFLAKNKKIPKETRNFIPKIIAAIKIAKNPLDYDFNDLNYKEPLKYDRLRFENSVDLLKMSSVLKVNYMTLKNLNPKYKTDLASANEDGEVVLRIPAGSYQSFK